MRTNSNS